MNESEITEYLESVNSVAEIYPFRITEYYKGLIASKNDAIWRQSMPSLLELENPDGLEDDGLCENPYSPLPRLIHRYTDRALILASNECFMYCRFCFRKRFRRTSCTMGALTEKETDEICAYLDEHREIHDVLISGGDPLTLGNDVLENIISRISESGEVDTIRICSRAPVVAPSRITPELAKIFSKYEKLWFVTHFNHPSELTDEAHEAIRLIQSAGVVVLNQTVLLKDVNDDEKILEKLFRGLAKWRVRPHYLFHADPIRGTGHFATGVAKGLEIMKYFRKALGSVALPVFALDLPEGGGKVVLVSDCSTETPGVYYSAEGRKIRHPLALKGDFE